MSKSPINWYGGKYYMAKTICDIMPIHKVYVEVFGGAGHLLFKKEPTDIEVYNDIDEGLYDFFKTIRDEEKAIKLQRLLELSLHNRKEFYNARDTWKEEDDGLEKVRKWYIHLMQSFSGNCSTWSHSKNVSRRGMSQATSKYLGNIDSNMPLAVERLRQVQIENMDCLELIKKYDAEEVLFYLDPPYVHSTRKENAKFIYNYEMTDDQHNKLVNSLMGIKGKAIMSGYDNQLYEKLLENGWKKIHIGEFKERSTKTVQEDKQKRDEYVWINYEIGI